MAKHCSLLQTIFHSRGAGFEDARSPRPRQVFTVDVPVTTLQKVWKLLAERWRKWAWNSTLEVRVDMAGPELQEAVSHQKKMLRESELE